MTHELFGEIERSEVTADLAESAFAMKLDWDGKPYVPPAPEQPGVYAWGEAHLLWAYVLQYEATGDTRYLDTFLRVVYRGDDHFADCVDGSGEGDKLADVIGYWGSLARVDRRIIDLIREHFHRKRPRMAGPVALLTLAMIGRGGRGRLPP